jgi:hypothetical protein
VALVEFGSTVVDLGDGKKAVRCVGCEKWVWESVTETIPTIMESSIAVKQPWCNLCIREIDTNSKEIFIDTIDNDLVVWDSKASANDILEDLTEETE